MRGEHLPALAELPILLQRLWLSGAACDSQKTGRRSFLDHRERRHFSIAPKNFLKITFYRGQDGSARTASVRFSETHFEGCAEIPPCKLVLTECLPLFQQRSMHCVVAGERPDFFRLGLQSADRVNVKRHILRGRCVAIWVRLAHRFFHLSHKPGSRITHKQTFLFLHEESLPRKGYRLDVKKTK